MVKYLQWFFLTEADVSYADMTEWQYLMSGLAQFS